MTAPLSVRWLSGLITVLRDAKYTDEEILEWMFTEDESLPGTPAAALHGPLAREVLRRAPGRPDLITPVPATRARRAGGTVIRRSKTA